MFRYYYAHNFEGEEVMKAAVLALADGTVFEGYSCGAEGEAVGEVVFNTSLTGYQEILTDPSYKGQIVVMTNPQIGNYGANEEDIESARPWVEGFVMKECAPRPSNWRATMSLDALLRRHGIVGIQGIDTRALTRRLRDHGEQMGVLSTIERDPRPLVERARSAPGLNGVDLTSAVSGRGGAETIVTPAPATAATTTGAPTVVIESVSAQVAAPVEGEAPRVLVYDFGVKYNILRMLAAAGCRVEIAPAGMTAGDVLRARPDGVLLSNGPGDPAAVRNGIEAARKLIGEIPIFGICLGHQILGIALGGKTYRLKFGHHGANHPVHDLLTGKVEITTQNHGFAVDPDSLGGRVEVTHVSLNDGTVEGMRHRNHPVFSVQFHPEASAGPHDARHLFDRFIAMIRKDR